MRFALLLVPLAVVSTLSASAAQAQETTPDPAVSEFEVVVEVDGSSVTATCEAGCSWESASATYPGGRYRISADGIAPATAEHDEAATFSFVVEASDGALSNRCDEGCAWLENSARYPGGRYRITETGIGPAN